MSSRATPPTQSAATATPKVKRRFLRTALRFGVRIAAVLLVLSAILFVAIRFVLWPQANVSREWLERELSARMQVQLTIGQIDTYWDGWRPAFRVRNLLGVDAQQRRQLAAEALEGSVSWRSIRHLSPLFQTLRVSGAEVLVRRDAQGHLFVAGMPADSGTASDDNPALDWLLQHGSLAVDKARVRWLDEQSGQPMLDIAEISLNTSRRTLYHTIALRARAERLSPAPIALDVNFRSSLLASAGDWRAWHGQATWDVQSLRIPVVARYLPPALRPDTVQDGTLTSAGSAEFRDGAIVRSQMRMRVQDINLQWRADADPVRLRSGQAFLSHQSNGKGAHSVLLDHLLWRSEQEAAVYGEDAYAELSHVPPRNGFRNVTVGWTLADDDSFRQLSLKAPEIDLDALRNLAVRLPLTPTAITALRTLRPGGRVENLDLAWHRDKPRDAQSPRSGLRYTARGALRNVGFYALPHLASGTDTPRPEHAMPGATGLTGSFEATERGGMATFDSQSLTINLPGVFDEPRLAFDTLRGRLQWRWKGEQLEVRSDKLEFGNADAAGSVSGAWHSTGKTEAGTLDIKGRLDRAVVQRVPRYLPSAISPTVRRYLAGALLAGEASDVTFVVNGDLAEFPFHGDNRGEFQVKVPVQGLTYQPAPAETRNGQPAWPAFDNGVGQVIFERRGMHFTVDRAGVAGIPGPSVTNVQGRIDDLDAHDAMLRLTGMATGGMQGFVQYVNRSRLADWSGNLTADTHATGTGVLNLSLDMPINHVNNTKADGKLRVVNSDLALLPDIPAFVRTNGFILFNEHGITLDGMRTTFAGGELAPTGGTQRDGSTRFEGKGQMTARGLQTLPGNPLGALGKRLSGSTAYATTVTINEHRPSVLVESSLEGLGIDLPAPLSKTTAQALPLRIELKPAESSAGRAEVLTAQIGNLVNARFDHQYANGKLKTVRGGIGVNQPAPTPASGVQADITVPQFDLDAWRNLLANDTGTAASGASSAEADSLHMPSRVTLRAQTVRLFDRHIDDVTVHATRAREWRLNIASKQIEGTATWNEASATTPGGTLVLRLKRLLIPQVPEETLVTEAIARRAERTETLPSLDLISDRFEVSGKSLGKLTIVARSETQDARPVWTLDRLALEQPAATFEAHGSWRMPRRLRAEADPERRTALTFTLALHDAGTLLDNMGIPRTLRGGKGKLEGRLAWRGSPMSVDYPTLAGKVVLELKDGVLLSIEPGAARLLGVLSLQGLARLVTFDFRGMASAGTVFDSTAASAEVRNGIATIDAFRMQSPQFTMEMRGTTNIPAETQQLEVTVLPKINATTASLATTFINPAIGLGTLAAQLLFADQVSSAFRQRYRVTGSWASPDIRKVEDNGKPE